MNTAHVSALLAGGVGKPLGRVGGACPLMATTTQPGCATTRLGRPLRVSFTVLASPGASSACAARCLASSHVSAGMGAGLGLAAVQGLARATGRSVQVYLTVTL